MKRSHPYKMDYLLQRKEAIDLKDKYGDEETKRVVKELLEKVKENWLKGEDILDEKDFFKLVSKKLEDIFKNPIQRIINATGVVIHTNLGRAPLSRKILLKSAEVLPYYVGIEWDKESKERGNRDKKIEPLLKTLFKTDKDVIVVNNCASALLLVLNTFSKRKETVVSRGELVEIGGKFRIPDIMLSSQAILKEVGTTNKTSISDYENAINEKTAILLKVHRSNFEIVGFSEEASLEEMVELGKRETLPVVFDFGTGLLFKKNASKKEKSLEEILKIDPDVITFSGDKLFGGCQAGFIVVKKELSEKIRKNNLLRALRVDKFVYFYLSEMAMEYLKGNFDEIPVLNLIFKDDKYLKERAIKLKEKIKSSSGNFYEVELKDEEGRIGGGSFPNYAIPSPALKINCKKCSTSGFEKFLRTNGEIPILCNVKDNAVFIHLRTLFEEDEDIIIEKLRKFAEGEK